MIEYSNHGLSLYQFDWNERFWWFIGYIGNFGWTGRSLHDLLISSGTDFAWKMSFEKAQAVRDDHGVTELTSDVTWLSEDEERRFWNSNDDDDDDELITFNSISCSSVRGFF